MNKEIVSWDNAYKWCHDIMAWMTNPSIIISVANGGIIPAAILARLYKVYKIHNIGIKSYEDKSKLESVQLYFEPNLVGESPLSNILVVDDILDSGNTFKYVEQYLYEKGFSNITFASLHFKHNPLIGQYVPKNYVYAVGCKSDVWVEYPWERTLT